MTTVPLLREPAHQVSPRAVSYWRLTSAVAALVQVLVVVVAWIVAPEPAWWVHLLGALLVAAALVRPAVMPGLRYRVHRWEVTPVAVFARSGWLTREQRIAPISRVQTVDSLQSALMRPFHLKSITVTTASAAGPVLIDCLDEETADRVVAELTAVTAEHAGDAT